MDEIQIQIVQTQIFQSLLACWFHVLRRVVSVPQFAGNVQLIPGAKSSFQGPADPVSDLQSTGAIH